MVDSEAAAWAARIDADPASAQPELEAWLTRDPRHAGALLRAQAVLVALGSELADVNISNEPTQTASQASSLARWRWAGAAGLVAAAAAIALFFAFLGGPTTSAPTIAYKTQLGETQQVALDDGSSVSIDAKTSLEIAYAPDRRLIRLADGRALFRAADEPGRPFQVIVGDITITDIGTEFQVFHDASGGLVDVIVTEGEILIESPAGRIALIAGQRVRLRQGEVQTRLPPAQTLAQADVARMTAWREGRLDLDGETLGDAVAQLNRANRIQIRISEGALAQRELFGSFRMNDPRGFAEAAALSLGAGVSEHDGVITIKR